MTTAMLTESARPRLVRAHAPRRRGRTRWLWLLVLGAGAAGLGVPLADRLRPPSAEAVPAPRALPIGVSALGRLAPEGDVIAAAPGSASDGGRVDRLDVAVGDRVQAGQVVALLDTHRRRQAAVHEAQAKVAVAKAKLAQVQAGPKPEDVNAQEALIRKNEAEVLQAETDLSRSTMLYKKNAASRQDFDDQRLKYREARESLSQARAQLEAIKDIRPTDVKVAEADVAQAEAALAVAQADVEAAEIRSPLSGRVLRIHARPGEHVGDEGVLDVGNTDVMHAVAEVYEEDVAKVRNGQKARVRVPTLGTELSGEVTRKDLVVARKVIFNNDPVADIDARVVEVRIRISPQDSPKVAGLSNARVEVVIDVAGGTK
jgi:HlyD family secretion protein